MLREAGITETTLYDGRSVARLAGAVLPSGGQRKAEEWDSPAKFAVVLETASLNEAALLVLAKNIVRSGNRTRTSDCTLGAPDDD